MKVKENIWKFMKIYEHIYNSWTSIKNDEHLWKDMKGYILYSGKMKLSYIGLPKKNNIFEQRKCKSCFSGKHCLWHVKHVSKSLCLWNYPKVNTNILRQPASPKTITQVKCSNEIWTFTFPANMWLWKVGKKIWLQKIRLQTAVSRLSCRASMSAPVSSP